MRSLAVLGLLLGLNMVLAMQVAPRSRPRGPFTPEEHREAERLVQQIQDSIRSALPGVEFSSSFTAEDLLDMAPPSPYTWEEIEAATRDAYGPMPHVRGKRDAGPEGGASSPDEDAEELPADGGEADGGAPGEPPATGLRRWVIRVRNFMFGRRDLEGSEGGEADGEPEAGRTWVESLAHWFAHGIKRILVRISGGNPDEAGAGGEGEEGEDDGAPEPGANPDDGDWRDPASARTPKHLPRPAPAPRAPPPPPPPASSAPATPAPTTPPSPPTARPPNVIPSTATSKTRRPVVTTPSNMVYDDEAFDDGKPTKPARPVEETNELS